MSNLLNEGMTMHNRLITKMEKASGDVQANLRRLVEGVHRDLILAANMEDAGKCADHVIMRAIDSMKNSLK